MGPMRRNASTVVVMAGSAPGEVLAAVGQSMNVTLIRPEDPADGDSDAIAVAAAALQRAGRTTSPYALVLADPLVAVAAGWQAMWDVSRQDGPAEFELEAAKALSAWRTGRFELPDYYLVLAADTGAKAGAAGAGAGPPVLGPCRWGCRYWPVPLAVAVPLAASAGRISTSVRCVRPGRTGWRSSPRRSPRPRPRVSCRRWGRCRTAHGGRAWTT